MESGYTLMRAAEDAEQSHEANDLMEAVGTPRTIVLIAIASCISAASSSVGRHR
jgi:hypothetical protein